LEKEASLWSTSLQSLKYLPMDPNQNPDPGIDAARWDGTLLKCPGCRLKFPFQAERLPLRTREFPALGGGGESRQVLLTHCPGCDGWVALS
jgi:hypothetical protein